MKIWASSFPSKAPPTSLHHVQSVSPGWNGYKKKNVWQGNLMDLRQSHKACWNREWTSRVMTSGDATLRVPWTPSSTLIPTHIHLPNTDMLTRGYHMGLCYSQHIANTIKTNPWGSWTMALRILKANDSVLMFPFATDFSSVLPLPVPILSLNLENRLCDVSTLYHVLGTGNHSLVSGCPWGLTIATGAYTPPCLWQAPSPRDHEKIFSDFSPRGNKQETHDFLIFNILLVGTRTNSYDHIRLSSKSNKTDSNFVISKYMPIWLRVGLNLSGLFISVLSGQRSLAKQPEEQNRMTRFNLLTKMCSFQGFQYIL